GARGRGPRRNPARLSRQHLRTMPWSRRRAGPRPRAVRVADLDGGPVALDAALGDPDRARARLTHLVEQVRDEEERLPAVAEPRHSRVALRAEPLVADGERLVHEKHVRVAVRRG